MLVSWPDKDCFRLVPPRIYCRRYKHCPVLSIQSVHKGVLITVLFYMFARYHRLQCRRSWSHHVFRHCVTFLLYHKQSYNTEQCLHKVFCISQKQESHERNITACLYSQCRYFCPMLFHIAWSLPKLLDFRNTKTVQRRSEEKSLTNDVNHIFICNILRPQESDVYKINHSRIS